MTEDKPSKPPAAKREMPGEVDVETDLAEHRGGPTDPTGHVSSGLQGGPLRQKGGRPVADNDEAEPPSTRERDLAEKNVRSLDDA